MTAFARLEDIPIVLLRRLWYLATGRRRDADLLDELVSIAS